ncbi:MAG: hypothetical protein NW220_24075 [Leptolyngbyaceae cyanobacterium bins.349]|nr:hypothetical protein [Leptolyngbyaceae cyanobacterium bins.349]
MHPNSLTEKLAPAIAVPTTEQVQSYWWCADRAIEEISGWMEALNVPNN